MKRTKLPTQIKVIMDAFKDNDKCIFWNQKIKIEIARRDPLGHYLFIHSGYVIINDKN